MKPHLGLAFGVGISASSAGALYRLTYTLSERESVFDYYTGSSLKPRDQMCTYDVDYGSNWKYTHIADVLTHFLSVGHELARLTSSGSADGFASEDQLRIGLFSSSPGKRLAVCQTFHSGGRSRDSGEHKPYSGW